VAIAYLALAWLLTEVAGTLFPAFGIPDWGVRFVVIVFALGFLPALIISWAYEITPEGLKREKDVVRDTSITHVTAKRLDGITIGLILVALVFILADRFWLSPRLTEQLVAPGTVKTNSGQTSEPQLAAPQYPPNSIAVLPFVNMSDDAGNEYFSDGISEELLNLLAKIPELRVISRSSAFAFKGEKADIPTVAKKLNVALVLEGSVRKAGNQVRITAQLIEASSDTHLWSETYDRELENIFEVQDEISMAIVSALKERLGLQIEVAPKVIAVANIEAHDAYLRGRYLVVLRTRAAVEGAVREFEKAITLDPDYALAHAELAIATLLQIRTQYGDLTTTEAAARATPHAEKAMALNPNLAEAHAATGFVSADRGKDEEAMTHYRRAIQINPNYSIVYTWLASKLSYYLGDYAEEFPMREISLQLDPLSLPARGNYIPKLLERNRLEEFDQELEPLAFTRPVFYAVLRGYRMAIGGNWSQYVLGCLDALKINPEERTSFAHPAWWLASLGLEEEALTYYENPKPGLLSLLGKHEAAVTTAAALLDAEPLSLRANRDMGLALASAGDYTRARPILEDMWQRSGGRVTRSGIFSTSGATALIAIRRDAGEESSTGELVAAIQDNVRRYNEAGITGTDEEYGVNYEAGLAAYLAGEREKGLVLIARGAEEGYFIPPGVAYLQMLYDDPGFAPIRKMQEARQTRERNKFLAIVCNDNPYDAVWQPAEGTCERFAAESGE